MQIQLSYKGYKAIGTVDEEKNIYLGTCEEYVFSGVNAVELIDNFMRIVDKYLMGEIVYEQA